ncbi:hypothetical protein BJX99DRAFT_272147 [Aspergillus californicus]
MSSLLSLQTQPGGSTDYIALAFLSLVGATYLSRGFIWDKPDPYQYLYFERPQLKHGNGPARQAEQHTRNIAHRLEETDSSIVVFWGSQSGTAESFAHRLAREITLRFGKNALTADLSDYDPASVMEIPNTKLAIFILSTYGEGDPSDNAVEFWDWMNAKDENEKSQKKFPDLKYFAFGLGNSNYKYYNRIVDRVVEVLDSRGATALLPVSRANDATGSTQEDFLWWKETLFTFFRENLGFTQSELVYQPTLTITNDENIDPASLHHGDPRHSPSPVAIPISGIRQLFEPSSTRHCLHIDLDISSTPDVVYKTGDHLAVWPSNPDEEVDLLLKMLGRAPEAEIPISVSGIEGADAEDVVKRIPFPTTLLVLLRHYLEITAQLPRDILSTLAAFAPTPEAKTFLTALANDKNVYAEFTRRNHLTLARVLAASSSSDQEVKEWTDLPLSYILETLPQLQPRYYSISSSSVVSPRKIALTVLVLSTPLVENTAVSIPGLTSTYLLSLADTPQSNNNAILPKYTNTLLPLTDTTTTTSTPPRKKILAHLRRSAFKLPRLSTTPLIFIAAGTGLAPIRAFLHERRQLLKIGREVGDMILFFGCRRPDEDFIYRDELEEMQSAFGGSLKVVTVFSRAGSESGSGSQMASQEVAISGKKYVQDAVVEHQDVVAEMLVEKRGNLYICGRAGMAREVERRVTGFLAEMKGWSGKESEDWVRGVKRRGKWLEDVWG